MSGNVLATIAHTLTLDRIDAMAERAAIERASARKAAELAVPAILAALSEGSSRASSIARLGEALEMGSTAAGPRQENSGAVIGFLLGNARAQTLAAVIGRFVGARESSALAFLDELTAAILGALREAGGQANANGQAVAKLLKAESEGIAAAMPLGLGSLLGANGFWRRPGGPAPPGPPAGKGSGGYRLGTGLAASALALALIGVVGLMLAPTLQQQTGQQQTGQQQTGQQQTGGGLGEGAVSALVAPDALPLRQGGIRAEVIATEDAQGADAFKRARDMIGSVSAWFGGSEERVAAALARLGRLVGIGGGGAALPPPDLVLGPDQGRSEERGEVHGLGAADKPGMRRPSAPALARQHLRFVPEEFRDAILIANEGAAGRLVTK